MVQFKQFYLRTAGFLGLNSQHFYLSNITWWILRYKSIITEVGNNFTFSHKKMTNFLQSAFRWMKISAIWLNFHWNVFLIIWLYCLENYIHQYWSITVFWLVFSTFLYKTFCLNISHLVTNISKRWCADVVSQILWMIISQYWFRFLVSSSNK